MSCASSPPLIWLWIFACSPPNCCYSCLHWNYSFYCSSVAQALWICFSVSYWRRVISQLTWRWEYHHSPGCHHRTLCSKSLDPACPSARQSFYPVLQNLSEEDFKANFASDFSDSSMARQAFQAPQVKGCSSWNTSMMKLDSDEQHNSPCALSARLLRAGIPCPLKIFATYCK